MYGVKLAFLLYGICLQYAVLPVRADRPTEQDSTWELQDILHAKPYDNILQNKSTPLDLQINHGSEGQVRPGSILIFKSTTSQRQT